MEKQLIKDLKIGGSVETQALVMEVSLVNYSSPHRSGEQFVRLTLGDISGTIRGIIWDVKLTGEPINKGDVLYLRGEVTDYHGPQIVINEARKLERDKVNRKMFQPVSQRSIPEMHNELKKIISHKIHDPYLVKLLELFFSDEEFVQSYISAPAAKTIHHNCIGGLLEHTLEVVSFCGKMMELYPEYLQEDLLLTGAILHDIGKIEEYDSESLYFEMSDRGKLTGHISIGKEMLDQRIARIPGFPARLKLELEHIILTHHGQKDWGSPEIPKTIHAYAIFYADLVSARLNQFIKIIQKHPPGEGNWTEWDRFLERSIYLHNRSDYGG